MAWIHILGMTAVYHSAVGAGIIAQSLLTKSHVKSLKLNIDHKRRFTEFCMGNLGFFPPKIIFWHYISQNMHVHQMYLTRGHFQFLADYRREKIDKFSMELQLH